MCGKSYYILLLLPLLAASCSERPEAVAPKEVPQEEALIQTSHSTLPVSDIRDTPPGARRPPPGTIHTNTIKQEPLPAE